VRTSYWGTGGRDGTAVPLREAAHYPVQFPVGNVMVFIDMTPGKPGSKIRKLEDVPNLGYNEAAVVTFLCGEGKLDKGNRIIDVKRGAR
jgi:hypothetical protein